MNQTKQTITQKTHKANLPDVSPANKKVIYVDSSGNMGVGIGIDNNAPFNGERPIVAPIPGLQGTTLHGTTKGEVLENLLKALYPEQGPTCSLIASLPQREHGAAPDVILYYNAFAGDNNLASLVVNGVIIDVDINQGAQNTATVQDQDTTFTMTVTDVHGLGSSASASVTYYHNRFWFASSTNLLTAGDAAISALLNGITSKEFATSRQQSRTFSPTGEYLYFAYPASFGPATFKVGGFANNAFQLKNFQYENPNGYVEPFILYRSGNSLSQPIDVAVN